MAASFVLKGNICYSKDLHTLHCVPNGYLVCEEGVSKGVFSALPEQYSRLPLYDYGEKMILPGLVDLHIHAPQFAFRGLGMDLELLDWLNTQTFPEEARYRDLEYADRAYSLFVDHLKHSPNTRASVFATCHVGATRLLMEKLEQSGLVTMVGKVNMDRNSPSDLQEESAEKSARDTIDWLEGCKDAYANTTPILTPRFIPSCTDELMERLGEIQREYKLPVQSHLSENQSEIAWVKELCPQSSCYGDAYARFGLFGGGVPTIMAHCVWSCEKEIELLRERRVYIAHCPQSNLNLASGIAPIRTCLEQGIPVGLGSDVAGGCHPSIFRAMSDAIQVSKLYWRLIDQSARPLSVEEAFYLGTVGGGSFFGKVGSLDNGYEFDALVLDDSDLAGPNPLSIAERLARILYLSENRHVCAKYVRGKSILGGEPAPVF